MADLTGDPRHETGVDRHQSTDTSDRRGPRGFTAESRGGRGQLILIAGFALAVTLIALALVMNAAIYTENLATRSESTGASSAHAYQRATANAAGDAFQYAHDVNNGTHAELERNVTHAMTVYGNITAYQEVTTGRVVNVSVDTTRGTNITGGDGGDFTDASGGGNWTVADDVTRVRGFTIHVSDASALAGSGPGTNEFRVVADGTSEQWVLNVTNNGGSTTVGVNRSGTYGTCSAPSSSFDMNLSAGTVAGSDCPALDLGETPDSYDLEFQNATAVEGEYSLVVNTNEVGNPSYAMGPPRARPALYSMSVEVVYRTSDLTYRTDIRVAPGEGDV